MKSGIHRRRAPIHGLLPFLFATGLTFLATSDLPGCVVENGNEPGPDLRRAGLTVDWFSNAGLGARETMADWYLHVDENQSTTFFTIAGGGYRETISANDRGPNGQPFGVEGGQKYANIRKEIIEAELAAAGMQDMTVTITQEARPKSTLFLLTSASVVHALDADTGQKLWTRSVGNPRFPAVGLGATSQHVAVANGNDLICLAADDGKLIWQRNCRTITSAPPTVDEDYIYVPLFDGRLERFPIDNDGFYARVFVSKGEIVTRPLLTPFTVSVGTSFGRLAVGSRWETDAILAYELTADDAIESQPGYWNGTIIATSKDGFIYSLDEKSGALLWENSTGSGIRQSPVILQSSAFVINARQELHKFNLSNGRRADGWSLPQPDVARFVGAGRENLYVLNNVGDLAIHNQQTGVRVDVVDIGPVNDVLPNQQTDRMYVVDNRGNVRCIREIASPNPYFHSAEVAASSDPGQPDNGGQPGNQPSSNNPFQINKPAQPTQPGTNANPFDTPATGGSNPAGGSGGGNPFDTTPAGGQKPPTPPSGNPFDTNGG